MLNVSPHAFGASHAPRRRKRICWLTPDYFLITDAPVVPRLAEHYDIDWLLVCTRNSKRKADGIGAAGHKPKEWHLKYRQRDPRVIGRYLALAAYIRRGNYDLVYTSFHGLPYFLPVIALLVNLDKVIYAVHNVSTPKGASHERSMRLYHRFVFQAFRRFHVFSDYQRRIIAGLLPSKTHYYAPFPLLDYGRSDVTPGPDTIRFLSFGYIRRYKRLDLLIRAFRNLRAAGLSHIELVIAGQCDDWEEYRQMIGDESGIETRIELIKSEDVPNVISSCHYLVLPYQDIAQSGVLTLAYQYGRPVIASDIEGFRHEVVEGTTGFFFESGSEQSLTEVMRKTIVDHPTQYTQLKRSMEHFVGREYSTDAVVAKYRVFIDDAVEAGR